MGWISASCLGLPLVLAGHSVFLASVCLPCEHQELFSVQLLLILFAYLSWSGARAEDDDDDWRQGLGALLCVEGLFCAAVSCLCYGGHGTLFQLLVAWTMWTVHLALLVLPRRPADLALGKETFPKVSPSKRA